MKNKTFGVLLIIAIILLIFTSWLSSGTLSPYANTQSSPLLVTHCNYLANVDHEVFEKTFYMLSGKDRSVWNSSVCLRRILFPLLAYPAMKCWGYEVGGFIVGALINVIAFVSFIFFLKKRIGERASVIGMVLLSTYPGIAYWVGQPYAYTLIVPCVIWLTMIMYKISDSKTILISALWGLVMGVLYTGYDLIVFFAPATILTLFFQKKYKHIPFTILTMLIPSIVVNMFYYYVHELPWSNNNTNVYSIIINSYLHITDFGAWMSIILKLPIIAINHFLFSNFIFIPLGFISIIFLLLLNKAIIPLSEIEISILISVVLLFLFNEAAPPYTAEWEMRGFWIARIYQPVFIVYVLYISRVFQTITIQKIKRGISIILIFVFLGNANIVFGQLVKSPISSYSYFLFYKHRGGYDMQIQNLNKYGIRPLGICKGIDEE